MVMGRVGEQVASFRQWRTWGRQLDLEQSKSDSRYGIQDAVAVHIIPAGEQMFFSSVVVVTFVSGS
jgi:hypothetical protein